MPLQALGLWSRRVVDITRSFLSCRPIRNRSRDLAQLATQSVQHTQQLYPGPQAMTQSFGNFDLVKRIKLDFTDVVVSKWRSRVTGLSIVHLDYEGEYIDVYAPLGELTD